MNGRRLDTKTYITAYQLCKHRDGEKCAICCGHIGDGISTKIQKKWKLTSNKIEKLEIDHIDGNPLNNDPRGDNWRLLCRACNLEAWVSSGGVVSVCECEREIVQGQKQADVKKGKKVRKGVKEEAEREAVEKEKRELRPATSIVKENVSYRDGESTMQANAFLQSAYGKWLVQELDARTFMPRKEAINGGAYVTGGSQITLTRYLDTYCSPQGPLEKFTADDTREILIKFKTKFLEMRRP